MILLKINEIARIIDIAEATIRHWGHKSKEKRGKEFYYDAEEIIQDYIRRLKKPGEETNLEREKLRIAKAQADKIEIINAQLRAEYIHFDDVQQIWEQHVKSAKTRLLTMPKTVSFEVAAETDPKIISKIIYEAVIDALNELEHDGSEYKKAAERRIGKRLEAAAEAQAE